MSVPKIKLHRRREGHDGRWYEVWVQDESDDLIKLADREFASGQWWDKEIWDFREVPDGN